MRFVSAVLIVAAGYGLLHEGSQQAGFGSSIALIAVGVFCLVHGSIIAYRIGRES